MKIKRFKARTFGQALEMVKKELSEEAVILSTEERKGLRPCVEVTAAIDYDKPGESASAENTQAAGAEDRLDEEPVVEVSAAGEQRSRTAVRGSKLPAASRGEFPILKANPQQAAGNELTPEFNPQSEIRLRPALSSAGTSAGWNTQSHAAKPDNLDRIRQEISSLRRTMETMRRSGFELAMPPHKQKAYAFLKERAVREEYAVLLCERIKDLNELPLLITQDVSVKSPGLTKKAVMFVGPTGSGKTTTIAKLAAQAIKAGRKVAIINLDTYRIGAVEQIRIYSRILGIPLAVATNKTELKNCLVKFAAERDIVFIDTTGRNPLDEQSMAELAEFCNMEVPLEVHLLMSANADDEFLMSAERSYRKLPISYIAFSKLDEAVRFGPLYNLAVTYRKPVSYLTTGQRVPGDIECATVNRLAGLITQKRAC